MIGTADATKTNVPVALAVFLFVAPVGIMFDQILVKALGRPYFLLPRLEFFLLGWPLIAIALAWICRKYHYKSVAKGLFWHGAVLLTASTSYFLFYLVYGMSL